MRMLNRKVEPESQSTPEPQRTLNDILEDRRKLDESYYRMSEELSIEYQQLMHEIYK